MITSTLLSGGTFKLADDLTLIFQFFSAVGAFILSSSRHNSSLHPKRDLLVIAIGQHIGQEAADYLAAI